MKDMDDLAAIMRDIGMRAKTASLEVGCSSASDRAAALAAAAKTILRRADDLISANRQDMEFGREKGLSAAMLDRLMLNDERISQMHDGLVSVAGQKDPVGRALAEWDMPSGLRIKRVSMPIGVIGVIYESRPNVTADAGALCLKSGNAVILRGGSESFNTAGIIHECLLEGLREAGVTVDAIQRVPTRDRQAVGEMLGMTEFIDVIVPRGGKGLVGRVQSEAKVPVFAHLEGICHVYVDGSADLDKARSVVLNSKTRRTGICGAAECLLVDKEFFDAHGNVLLEDLVKAGVEVRADGELASAEGARSASDSDFGKEFLDMIIACKLVEGVDGAIDHIRQFGSSHTDAIIAEDDKAAAAFFSKLDSAILMRNASTQFADGGEFGMGAEIGIATGKLHARGPVGVDQLTSFRYIVEGDGTIRP